MPRRNLQFQERIERAAREMQGAFDYQDLFAVVNNLERTSGGKYTITPSANVVRSLLSRAPYARPIGERMVPDRQGKQQARAIYMYDPTWGAERTAQRVAVHQEAPA